MRLVHSSDWHLSYRAYQRLTPTGANQREHDVAISLTRFVDRVLEIRPDVLLVGGDVFHAPRPSNPAILHLFNQLARLRDGVPAMEIVIVAGNHDVPKQAGDGCILQLYSHLGIHVVDRHARWLTAGGDCAILAIPDVANIQRPPLEPYAGMRYNVAIVHGEASGSKQSGSRDAATEIAIGDLTGWDYVGFGHYHCYEQLAPKCYYSGSLDYVSSNPWAEISTPKGFIEQDLATGEHRFHELTPARRFVDLDPIDARGMGAEQVDAAIRDAAAAHGDLDGAVVRLVVHNVTREVQRGLDARSLKAVRRGMLNFQLDCQRPEVEKRAPMARTYAELRQRSLKDILLERLGQRELPNDVDRAAFNAAVLGYFDSATEKIGEATVDPLVAPLPEPARRSA